MRVSNMFGRNKSSSAEEVPKDKPKGSGKKEQEKGWMRALNDEDDDDASSNLSDISNSTEGETGEYVGSIDEQSEDYQRFEKKLRNKHARACTAMSDGLYKKALSEFESILSDLLGRYGERHERVGAALHNVAIANLRAGSLDDAMDAIEEAIKIRSRALGRSHPRVADSLVELGIILLSMDEHDDALKVFERALKLRKEEGEDAYGPEDIDECNLKIAKVMNNIGCVNFEKGEFNIANASFDEAIRLQRGVFRSWIPLVCGLDGNSPGILTMASTMCNQAYVEIQQDNFQEALFLFEDSLKIQRSVLGTENKLVQSSLDNIGYAWIMLGRVDKALKSFEEVWDAVKNSKDFLDEKVECVRKVIICYVRLQKWAKAFELLEVMEDMQRELDPDSKSLVHIARLMGEVNYQILKLPSLSSATNRALGCAVCMGPDEEDVNLDAWIIHKPDNTSKMSGHRVTHA